MNIADIDGTGLISAKAARQLGDAGHSVSLHHRGHSTSLPCRQFQGDRDDAGKLSERIASANPDCVLRACAMSEDAVNAPASAMDGKSARVAVISSAGVYKAFEVANKLSNAPVQAAPLGENSPLRDVRDFRGGYEKIDVEAAASEMNVERHVKPGRKARQTVPEGARHGASRSQLPRNLPPPGGARQIKIDLADLELHAFGDSLSQGGAPSRIYGVGRREGLGPAALNQNQHESLAPGHGQRFELRQVPCPPNALGVRKQGHG